MSNNIPSFDYSGGIKESPRESAKQCFERRPYEISGISVQEYMESLKERRKGDGD